MTIKCEPKTDVITRAAPTVTITSPSENPYISTDCKATIKASIANIDNKGNIEIKINGQVISSNLYTYDATTKILTFNTTITQLSVISIQAVNTTGIASATTTVKCEPPVATKPKPIVTITSPNNNYTAENCKAIILATIKNIESKNELVVKQDNQIIAANLIEFNTTNKSIKVNVSLTGTSKFTIVAGNSGGYDSSSIVINCIPKTEVPKPIVTITSPEANHLANDCKANITATIQNIESKNNLVIKQGGFILAESDYSYNTSTKVLSINSTIKETTTFDITASNTSGSATSSITIRCIPVVAVPKPIVSITSPEPNHMANDCKAIITATIHNIDGINNVMVKQGGNIVPSDKYTYNVSSRTLTINSDMKETSTFDITATNNSGSVTSSITIRCIPVVAVPKPVVTITSPEANHLASDCKANITATIQNIENKNSIVVKQGGFILVESNYSYNASTKVLSINADIKETTTFDITATNASGSTTSTITIRCIPVVAAPKPIITITGPEPNHTANDCKAIITATIRNIDNINSITVNQAGTVLAADKYSYNTSSKTLTINSDIKETTTFNITATNTSGSVSSSITIRCTPVVAIPNPIVTITSPEANHLANDCKATITATIQNIQGVNSIVVKQAGSILSQDKYSYNTSTKVVTINSDIKETSIFEISASNTSGTASDNVTIRCVPKVAIPKPIITITSPESNHIANDCQAIITATIRNIEGVNGIVVKQAGNILSSEKYVYNTSSKILTITSDINGNTIFDIIATNSAGSVSSNITIRCIPAVAIPKPIITITSPEPNHLASDCKASITATIQNIQGINSIVVKQGGNILSSDKYNYNASTKVLTISSDIKAATLFEITATNASGTASVAITINCAPKAEVKLPEIIVNSPTTSPAVVENCKADLSAFVKNISSQNNIVVLKDGKTLNQTDYSFNPSNQLLTLSASFSDKVVFLIRASNEAGTIEKTIQFECKPKTEPIVTTDQCGCNKNIITAPQYYYNEYRAIPQGTSNLTVNQGDKVMVQPGTTFTGSIQMNGGSLAIGGRADVSNINFNSGEIINLGTATFTNINMNNATSSLKNYSTISFTNITFNGTVENYGTMAISQDFNINSSANFSNSGIVNISGNLNNNNRVLNKGKINVSNKVQNNGSGDFNNSCKLTVSNELLNNSSFTNYGNIVVSATTTLNSGKLSMKGGSTLTTGNITVNATIEGEATYCSSIKVSSRTSLNSSAKITGKVEICDNNGIEQNNILFAASCLCQAKACSDVSLPTPSVPSTAVEEKVTICHYPPGNIDNPQTLSVGKSALQAHLDHGDKLGTCEDVKKAEDIAKQKAEEERIKKEAEEKAKQDAADKAKAEQEKIRKEAAEKAAQQAEQERIKKEAEEKAKQDAADKAKAEHERIRKEAEEKAAQQAEQERIKKEAEEKAKQDAADKAKAEQERLENEEKVTICHYPPGNPGNPQTLSVGKSAVQAHLNHGDKLGTCEEIKQAEEKAEQEKIRKAAEEKAKQDAADKAKAEQERIRKEAEEKAAKQAEQERIRKEAEEKAERERLENEEKVTICHYPPGNPGNPQTLSVGKSAVQAHLNHGDKLGTCEEIKETEEKAEQEKIRKAAEEKAKQEAADKAKAELERIRKEAEEKAVQQVEQERIRKEAEEKAERERLENEEKVTICHYPPGNPGNPQTLSVGKSAVQAHLNHGDKLGTCEEIKQAEEKAQQEKIRKAAEEKAKQEAAQKAKADQERIKKEAEEKAKQEELEKQETKPDNTDQKAPQE